MFLFGWLRIACFLQVRKPSPDLVWTQPKAGRELALGLLFGLEFVLESAREHVGENLEGHGQKQLHEGDDHEDGHGDQAEDVGGGAGQLATLAPVELLAAEDFETQARRDADILRKK